MTTKLTIPRPSLAAALSLTARAARGNTSRPILRRILLRDGVIAATDLELRVEVRVLDDASHPPTTIDHARLSAIVKTLPADVDAVHLTIEDASVKVAAGGGRWTLPTEDAAEFPAGGIGPEEPFGTFSGERWREIARQTVGCTDTESSRYALGGVLLEVADGTLHAVATDGRRLHHVSEPTPVSNRSAIVTRNAMETIAAAAVGEVSISRTAAEIVARCGEVTIVGRLVEGRFPTWRDVLPAKAGTPCRFVVGALLSAVRQAAIVTTEHSKGVRVKVGDAITLEAKSSEFGESRVRCDLAEATKLWLETRLDPQFVGLVLGVLPVDAVAELTAKDAESAVVIRCGTFDAVIMPLAKE